METKHNCWTCEHRFIPEHLGGRASACRHPEMQKQGNRIIEATNDGSAPIWCPLLASEWQPIETAPKDWTEITVRRIYEGRLIYEGPAVWRECHFGAIAADALGRYGGFPGYSDTGWMRPARLSEKRVPEPTEWRPS